MVAWPSPLGEQTMLLVSNWPPHTRPELVTDARAGLLLVKVKSTAMMLPVELRAVAVTAETWPSFKLKLAGLRVTDAATGVVTFPPPHPAIETRQTRDKTAANHRAAETCRMHPPRTARGRRTHRIVR